MEENYREKRVLNDFAKKIGNPYGLEKNKEAVLDVLKDHHIDKNLDKEAGYKRDAVVKDITKIIGLDYETRKSVAAFGVKKPETVKPKINAGADRKRIYDEIMAKRNRNVRIESGNKTLGDRRTIVQDFSVSNKHMRSETLVHGTNKKSVYRSQSRLFHGSSENNNGIKDMLRRIQS